MNDSWTSDDRPELIGSFSSNNKNVNTQEIGKSGRRVNSSSSIRLEDFLFFFFFLGIACRYLLFKRTFGRLRYDITHKRRDCEAAPGLVLECEASDSFGRTVLFSR